MISEKDEFYRDILEGMAIYTGSAFQRDVLAALSRHDEPGIGRALNKNQMGSKMWLADTLLAVVGPNPGRVLILGGWMGVLGAVLLHDRRFTIDHIVSIDIDPRCAAVAEAINATHVRQGRFAAQTADMLEMNYGAIPAAAAGPDPGPFDLVINTSCEHLAEFDRWWQRIPDGQLLVLQSNDYYAVAEHVNCVPDLAAFRSQAPLREVMFAGERKLRRYVRFMLIGRK
ncbi:MAG: class I SAM-dependent methyltransferase [Betaproteobacteria bacterium]